MLDIELMSKTMIVTLPFILLLLDYWPLQRISFSNNNQHVSTITENKNNNKILIKIIMEKLPFFALSVISCIITFYAQFRGGAVAKTKLVPISFRIFNSLVAYVNYIFKMILPINLSISYCRMALVYRDAGSCDWPGTSRKTIHGGPIHLFATHWAIHNSDMGYSINCTNGASQKQDFSHYVFANSIDVFTICVRYSKTEPLFAV